MNPETSSLVSVCLFFSRREWLAVARLVGLAWVVVCLSGCVVAGRPRAVVTAKVPAAVVVADSPRAPDTVVIIRDTPPPLRREVIVERDRPSKGHVWIAGHWRHDGRVYTWVPGHWAKPPHARAVWVEPRWEKRDAGFIFIAGVWR